LLPANKKFAALLESRDETVIDDVKTACESEPDCGLPPL
jgi:hypothetical protein